MKAEFLQLLQVNYDDKYIAQIEDRAYASILKLGFAKKDLELRESFLDEKLFRTIDSSKYKIFANPYFIGFGNPNSDILVIGKEKAFPADNSNLLMKESINNYQQWKIIMDNNLFEIDQVELATKLGFNPLLPKSFHLGKTKRAHTWSITSSIISQVFPERNLLVDESNDLKRSFFNNCFLTELNHRPAKYHEGSGLDPVRQEFLMSSFFKSFPIVIFSAKSYLSGTDKILEKIFDIKQSSKREIELDRIGEDKDKVLLITKYSSSKQIIYVCNQLSGASGWSNASLTNFASQIRNDLIETGNLTSVH